MNDLQYTDRNGFNICIFGTVLSKGEKEGERERDWWHSQFPLCSYSIRDSPNLNPCLVWDQTVVSGKVVKGY